LKTIFKLLEADLEMLGRCGLRAISMLLSKPIHVEPFEMDRVDTILLALKPVAGHLGKEDVDKTPVPGERLPIWQLRCR
jgi:hypothetical protein